jgi:hypothetical protein
MSRAGLCELSVRYPLVLAWSPPDRVVAVNIVRAHFSAPATSRKEKMHAESNQEWFVHLRC